jgi:phytoene/squalene synthetase
MNATLSVDKTDFYRIFESIDFGKVIDHPNILIAAAFWNDERSQAARVCYKFMRYIDDFVDNYKSEHTTIEAGEQAEFEKHVNKWIDAVIYPGKESDLFPEITATIRKFHIPAWHMQDFARSMIYDIYHDGFTSLDAFLEYSKGASVAPASVFVHLCGLRNHDGMYLSPVFNVKKAATPCAVFSYLVHIIRDFVKDHTHHLNYFPDDLMQKNGLNRENLLQMAQGASLTSGFRNMIAELYAVADHYRLETVKVKEEIKPMLEVHSQLSLDIVFALYDMVFERINVKNGSFTTTELNPTAAEIRKKVGEVIENF